RTVRHLTAEQWAHRFLCRGRMAVARRLPGLCRARVERAAAKLPMPDAVRPEIAAVADIVRTLQTAVHGTTFAEAPRGRFRLLNRDFDFGSVEGIAWRGDFGEGANPLRRMVLAYMGYVVPLLATGAPEGLSATRRMLAGLEAQSPWSAPGVLRDVWNAYAASHRLINLLSGLALYRRAGGPADPDAEREILAHVRLCAEFVRRNLERDIQFNHLMKNLVALSVYAAGCGTPPAPLRFLAGAVPTALRRNVLGDGGHAERSPMYHALALLDVRMLAASRLFPEDWQPALDGIEAKMTAALAAMSHADGDIALFNDSWIGEAPSAGALAPVAASGLSRLPETGYVRLAGGDDDAVFDCGPCGPDAQPGHAHADFLSVETAVGGVRFLVDTGVPTYTAGPLRGSSRSAAAHNGPRLTDAEPVEFWKSFRVGRRGRAGELDPDAFADHGWRGTPLRAAGWQDGYGFLGVDVRRLVALWPGEGLLVADLWTGAGLDGATSDFRIDGSWAISASGVFGRDGTEVSVSALAGMLAVPEPASCWRRFDVARPAHLLRLTPDRDAGTARAAVYFGWSDAPPPDAGRLGDLFSRLGAAEKIPAQVRVP
ncbi:MAG: alginate lyase family protein, partial [Rhodospirillaceae bacterium]